jgi:radical SAM superfamily enzyme YgiQ (UPF0313 family)
MKVLLAYQSGLPHRNDPYISLVPTGLCYLHACLREAGHESLLANFSAWPNTRIKKELLAFKPDIIGISQWTHNRHTSLELAGLCRTILPGCIIVFGGGHATFCCEDNLFEGSPVDVVVRGEAEVTLQELVSAVAAGTPWHDIHGLAFRDNGVIILTPNRQAIEDLDRLPLPARYLDNSIGIDLEFQPEFIVTTRGCPSTCYFCSSPDFWGRKVRFRSPKAIVEEIRYIRDIYGLIYFSIRDDTFTADRKRVLEFCTLLRQQNIHILWNCQSRVTAIDEELVIAMKRAGCECIQLGVESGSIRMLQQLGKRITPPQIERACAVIRKIGINLSVYLISDIPGESDDDVKQSIELIRKIQPDDGYVSPLAYFPGTRLYKDALTSGSTTDTLFSDSKQTALYVASSNAASAPRLMSVLTKKTRGDSERFSRQKNMLGYCFTTNIIAAEWYRQGGAYDKAEEELTEITRIEPANPWGWLLLGDLCFELGRIKRGKEFYRKVIDLVPQHGPARSALSS